MGKMRLDLVFDLDNGKRVNSAHLSEILTEPLQEFWEESFGNVEEPIVTEDNAPPHEKVAIPILNVTIEWILGHRDIPGHERAEEEAKKAAREKGGLGKPFQHRGLKSLQN